MSGSKVTLKLQIDKHTNKVLYAEAGKDCVDFLFHVFMLPVGSAMNLLLTDKTSSANTFSLGNLYNSIRSSNISPNYLQDGISISSFNPRVTSPDASDVVPLWSSSHLPERVKPTYPKPVYVCSHLFPDRIEQPYRPPDGWCNYSDVNYAICECCNLRMDKCLTYIRPPVKVPNAENTPGYVKGQVTYMITDDLVVKPVSSKSTIELLGALHINDFSCIQETVVTLDTNLGMALLKTSLTSKTVLTDIFLRAKVE